METRTYTERSNARRAARAFGVDMDSITETEDGFTFELPSRDVTHPHESKQSVRKTGDVTDISFAEMTGADLQPKPDLDGIPEFCKIPQEKRKESWIKNPPKVAAANLKEAITMAKSKAKEKKPRGEKGADKTATLLSMLKGKGSTVEQLTKALDWLPHTLRARLSRVAKPKTKGGEGLKLERERVDGVTTYRIA